MQYLSNQSYLKKARQKILEVGIRVKLVKREEVYLKLSYLYILVNHLLAKTWFVVKTSRRFLLFDQIFCLSKTKHKKDATASELLECSSGSISTKQSPKPGSWFKLFRTRPAWFIVFLNCELKEFPYPESYVVVGRELLLLDFGPA